MRQRPGSGCIGSSTPIDCCRGVKKTGGSAMTDGEIAYLSLVLVLFVAFLAVVGAAAATQRKRPGE